MRQLLFADKLFRMTLVNSKIRIHPSFCVGLCISLLTLPIPWVTAWLFAAVIHELGHYVALNILHIPVLRMTLCYNGAYIETGYMTKWGELFSAAAGPTAGIVCVFLYSYFPKLAICAFIQSVYNLLPLPDYDGGRIIKSVIRCFLPPIIADGVYSGVVLGVCLLLVLLGIYFWLIARLGIILFLICVMPVIKYYITKIPCKGTKQIVQ